MCCVIAAISFGIISAVAPLTYGAGGCNPVTLTLLRCVLVLPVLVLLLPIFKIPLTLTKKQLLWVVALGLLGGALPALLLNIALSMIDVGVATTLHFCYPIFVMLGSAFLFRDKISKAQVAALALATGGIMVFLAGGVGESSNFLLGAVIALISGVIYAFYILLLDKSGLAKENPLKINFYTSSVTVIFMLLYGAFTRQLQFSTITKQSWVLLFLCGLAGMLLGMSLLQIGIRNTGAATAAILSTFEPLTGVVVGHFLLGEAITPVKVTACALIFLGVSVIAVFGGKGEKVQQSADAAASE